MKTPAVNVFFLLFLLTGCTDQSRIEIAELSAKVEAQAKTNTVIQADLAKRTAELESLRERLAEAKTQHDDLSSRLLAQQKEIELLRVQLAGAKGETEPRKGEIVGSVTYYFNLNFGYKPDVGAEVFIWKGDAYPDFDPKTIELRSFQNSIGKDDSLERDLSPVLWGQQTQRLNVDGSGGFRRSLSPGKYCVFVESANRRPQVEFNIVKIKPGEEANVSAQFHVN